MLDVKTTLPKLFSPDNATVSVGVRGVRFFISFDRYGETKYFLFDSRLLILIILLLAGILFIDTGQEVPSQVTHVYHYIPTGPTTTPGKLNEPQNPKEENKLPVYVASNETASNEPSIFDEPIEKGDVRKRFIQAKQKLIYEFTTKHNVVRTAQLNNDQLLELNRRMSNLFTGIVLNNIDIKPHVMQFFTDTTELHKLHTSLVEQDKYHVPASITLAQAALETSYGRKVKENNYFGIKDKSKKSTQTTTTEYYTAEEAQANSYKILTKKKVNVNGKTMYKCAIKDHFKQYQSPWESFRAHSIYLSKNPRYAPLFTGGKNFEAWADKIGSMKQGGVGYATDPIYGRVLKKIIQRYHLDLLDH